MITFTVVAYDKDTYESISEAMHGDAGCHSICRVDADSTWREIKLIELTLRKSLTCMGCTTAVGLAVINDKDTVTFPFMQLCPEDGVQRQRQPMQEAEQIYENLTATNVRLNTADITALMKLLPLGNSSHSGVREKLHQASLSIAQKASV
jgi:hypothetical protein